MVTTSTSSNETHQGGFTLVELMIALLIGLFLLGALIGIVQGNRRVFADQNQLAQLQDSERMAMTLMTDVIQSAGYFPDPTTNVATTSLPAAAPFAAGQSITGTYNAATPGDTISLRYQTFSGAAGSGDGILNCSGQSNTTGSNQVYVNTFQVTNGQLVCTLGATTYNLVSGVTNLTVLYGVKTNVATTGNDIDTYLNANQMTAAYWGRVIAVMVKLTFTNPLYNAAYPNGQPQTFTMQRVVGVMNQAGPTV